MKRMNNTKTLQKTSLFFLIVLFTMSVFSGYVQGGDIIVGTGEPAPDINAVVQGTFDSPTTTSTFSGLVCNITTFISETILPPIAVLMMLAVGFMFLISQGDPGKTATAKKGLLFAAVGVLLLLLAPSVVSLIMSIFDTTLAPNTACSPSAVTGSIVNTLLSLVNWFSWFVGVTSVVMGLYGGFLFMTAKDDPAQAKKARGVVAYTIIGIAVAVIAFSIIALVETFMG